MRARGDPLPLLLPLLLKFCGSGERHSKICPKKLD